MRSIGRITGATVHGATLQPGRLAHGRWHAQVDSSAVTDTNLDTSLRLVRLLAPGGPDTPVVPHGDQPVTITVTGTGGTDTYAFSADHRHRHLFERTWHDRPDGPTVLAVLANPFAQEDEPVDAHVRRPTLDALAALLAASDVDPQRVQVRNLLTVRTNKLAEALARPTDQQRDRPISADISHAADADLVVLAWGGAGAKADDLVAQALTQLHDLQANVQLRARDGTYFVAGDPPQPAHPKPRALNLSGSRLHPAPAAWLAGTANLPDGIRGGSHAGSTTIRKAPADAAATPAHQPAAQPTVDWDRGEPVDLEGLLSGTGDDPARTRAAMVALPSAQRTALKRLLIRDVPLRTSDGPARPDAHADLLLEAADGSIPRLLQLLAAIAVDAGGTGSWPDQRPPELSDLLDVPTTHPEEPPATHWGWVATDDGLRRPGPARKWRTAPDPQLAAARTGEPHVRALDEVLQQLVGSDAAWVHPDAAGDRARLLVLHGPAGTDPVGAWPPPPLVSALRDTSQPPSHVQTWDVAPSGAPDDLTVQATAVADVADALPSLRRIVAIGQRAAAVAAMPNVAAATVHVQALSSVEELANLRPD